MAYRGVSEYSYTRPDVSEPPRVRTSAPGAAPTPAGRRTGQTEAVVVANDDRDVCVSRAVRYRRTGCRCVPSARTTPAAPRPAAPSDSLERLDRVIATLSG